MAVTNRAQHKHVGGGGRMNTDGRGGRMSRKMWEQHAWEGGNGASVATTNYEQHPPPLPRAIAHGVERGANVKGDLHGCKGGDEQCET